MMFHGSAYPKEISQQCTYTSIPVSDHKRLLDPPLGEGRQASHHHSDASTARSRCDMTKCHHTFLFKCKLSTTSFQVFFLLPPGLTPTLYITMCISFLSQHGYVINAPLDSNEYATK